MHARDGRVLYSGLGALASLVFIADTMTPLGVAIWILYVVPLGLTLLGREPAAPLVGAFGATLLMLATLSVERTVVEPWVAYVNRACGIVVIWTIAFLARGLIVHRSRLQVEDWMRGTQMELLERLQGELSLREIGDRALAVIAGAIRAPVAALYTNDGTALRLAATLGLRPGAELPDSFEPGSGLVGEAARSRKVTVLRHLPESHFTVRSAFVAGPPSHLLVTPVIADRSAEGVMEIGCLEPPTQQTLDLVERTQHAVAIAIRTAYYRDRLRTLLEETRRQAATLQAQQEELRVTNEELEEQGRALRDSQARLEEQQAELEATNAELEMQAEQLERQKASLTRSQQEAERANQYKSEFLANMSHELRTPLNSTLILAKLLADNKDGHLSPDQVRYADTIYASGNTLLSLINDILDLSKIEAGAVEVSPEPLSPREALEGLQRTFQPMADEKGLAFTIAIDPGTPDTITTDRQRLQQILMNLLSNAFKFTERGSVTLRVGPAGRDTVLFEVRDTGIGIPEDKQEIVFEAFRQADGSTHRQYGGTGLGLSISLELARLLGGSIGVTSEVRAGSTFTLILPAAFAARPRADRPPRRPAAASSSASARAEAPTAPPDPPAPPRRTAAEAIPDDREHRERPGRLILVIEDDAVFARILLDLAHELDFDCVVAGTVDEGLALARELSPSGILLDVDLPDGSGLTLLDRLKRTPEARHIPVHMVSVSDYTQTALALGAVGYAVKPVRRDDLVAALRKLEARSPDRLRRVLVVEDDRTMRDSIRALLTLEDVAIEAVGTAGDALARLASQSFDCVILDLNLPDASGYDILEQMSRSGQYSFPPVIVYTGRPLSREDEERLRRYSRSVIVKGARSPERLLDEVTLFLHQVESRLPSDSLGLLRMARERDDLFAGRTILVVEDDVRNVFALTSVFEPRGATVAIARNGREGVAQAAARRPDLVLMDIMMPEMDGLSAIRAIRERPELRDLRIIALTAKATRQDYEQCLAAGANDYLAKPLDVDKLVSLCRVWLSR